MQERAELIRKIKTANQNNFDRIALQLFIYQYKYNPIYKQYCDYLNTDIQSVNKIEKIPYLPIQFFKKYVIQAADFKPQIVFESSKTTGQISSKHYVKDLSLYHQLALRSYKSFFNQPFVLFALLPSYLERDNSSLVSMVQYFIEQSQMPMSGFYLNEYGLLHEKIKSCQKQNLKILLLGVSFALLDFAEKFKVNYHGLHVMETGGMKGRREELTKQQLHNQLKQLYQVENVYSEYGMTELLSQAYSLADGLFTPSSTMKVIVKEFNDPFQLESFGKRGVLNIIDLVNIDSCAFIATEDIGRMYPNGKFEILGRLDASEIRGCNLMFDQLKI